LTPRVPANGISAVSTQLAQTPFWSALSDAEREKLAASASIMTASKGEVLIEEGTGAHSLFLVDRGAMRLARLNGLGHRIIAGFLFQGDFVGACIGDHYPFSVEAIDDVVLCRLQRGHIREMNCENHGLEWRILSAGSNEFLHCQIHLDIVLGGSVEAKLARFLLHIGKRIGQPAGDGTHINLPMSREDIAHYLGHSLETVSRAFTKLREHDAIETPHRTQLVITDDDRLREIAETDG